MKKIWKNGRFTPAAEFLMFWSILVLACIGLFTAPTPQDRYEAQEALR